MVEVVDPATGERQVLNDIRGAMNATRMLTIPVHEAAKPRRNLSCSAKTPQGTPEYQLLLLQYFTLLDASKGVEMMRDYANKQLIQMGVKKPETPEEQQWLVEAQQSQNKVNKTRQWFRRSGVPQGQLNWLKLRTRRCPCKSMHSRSAEPA